jgi:hypothetical protein
VASVADDGGQEAWRRSGGGGGQSKKERVKCVCANARAVVLGTPGCARSPEEEMGLCRSRSWHAGGASGGTAKLR